MRKRRKGALRRVRDTCKEENEEGPTLTGRWSAIVRPSVFSGNNRKRNICARNATRSLPLSLSSRSPSRLFLLYFILRSSLPVYPPRRRLRLTFPTTLLGCKARTVSVVKFVFSRERPRRPIGRRSSWNDISYVIFRNLILLNI